MSFALIGTTASGKVSFILDGSTTLNDVSDTTLTLTIRTLLVQP